MEVIKENQNTTEMNDENIVDMSKDPDRLDQILTDYQRVHEAATNEIDRKRRAVRTKCEERVWMAALWRDYQLEIVKKSFENEIRQIEREHQSEFNSLKEALMQELQEERRKLQALEEASAGAFSVDKTGNLVMAKDSMGDAVTAAILAAEEQASAAANSRRLRRREEKASEALNGASSSNNLSNNASTNANSSNGSSFVASNNNRRKQVNNIYTYNTMLQEQDILDDLGAIAKEAGSLGTGRRAAAAASSSVTKSTVTSSNSANVVSSNVNINVSFDKGVLHYNWDIIGASDRIRLQLAPNTAAINCTVLACTAAELVVSTPTRNQIKIPLADLKGGKVTIFTEDHLLHDN